jgi:hypothetical protein
VDTRTACSNLDSRCSASSFVAQGADKYVIVNNMVAYFCNMAPSMNNCYASERVDVTNLVSAPCGSYIASDDTVPERSVVYGY